jgi:mitogen-activated protein kinase 1/3
VNVLGSPSEEDVAFISHESAKKVIREMGNRPKLPLRKHFPECTPLALDLLERMLVFNPEKRITVDVSHAIDASYSMESLMPSFVV